MRILLKIFKWLAKVIGLLLALIIVAGLVWRIIGPDPEPPGKLVDIGGFKLHINATGQKNNKPTLVIESGAGAPSGGYYWLGEGLKDSIRVIRYDRAGIGYSDFSNVQRNPETIARELHTLLEKSGESPPYIMAGHSFGGHYIKVFTKIYPDEVAALVFLDAPHPDINKRLNLPEPPAYLNALYKAGAVIGDMGILNLFDRMLGPILWAPGLPQEVIDKFYDHTSNGKYIRGYLAEERYYEDLEEMSRQASQFDSLPIRVFSGVKLNERALRKMGLDPEKMRVERIKMQEEIASLSSNGEVIFLEGGHVTIFTEKENADIICKEILTLLEELK